MPRSLLLLPLLLVLAACARNPVTGKRQFSLVSQGDEIAIGQQAAKDVQQSIGLVANPQLQQYVSTIGLSMARQSERPDLPWSFQVVDDPAVNAFALPGGPVFVTRGLMAHLNSEAELAAVIGHEIGHITAKHSVSQISKAQLAQLGLGVGAILEPDLAKYGQLASAGLQLLFLKYGRDAENQSDELGFRYMVAQGYDPREMQDVFVTLGKVGEASGAGRLPTWLATHPNPEDRLEKTQERLARLGTLPEGRKVVQAEYLRMLQGLAYGENPRQGFFRGNLFLHPELRFQFEFPQGWQTANQTQAVLGASPQQDALVGLGTVGGLSPEQALQQFFSQPGIAPLVVPATGLPPATSYFEAQTEQGVIRGLTTFLSWRGGTLQLVGYTVAAQLPQYDSAFRATFASFRELTDPAALAAQPARIELVTLDQAMTLEQFQARSPSTVSLAELALINGVQPGETLAAGRLVKRVTGGVSPSP
ncbi:M48 family metalloprotease [Hyalangium rubrum]|uniref:M48 family metalloprotease n=1 Tax=Hyalangium rubrum TaxID=3103134 RepID=A0ABU5H1T9_9BACT|nr:M48 family metalloprotease [Hyalangium sp. s54d21]MDY7227421.1 M48 family metalloprotease [Hyalangium sp. s54d21]